MRAGDGGECTTNTHRTATHASSPEEDNGDDLLVMVQKLAHGDTRGTAAERTLRLLRRAVVDASTRELTNRDDDEQETDNAADRTTAVFANVLSHYDGLGVTCASVRQWTLIFLTEIATATDDATLAGSARAFKAVAGLEISGTSCISPIQRLFDHTILTLFWQSSETKKTGPPKTPWLGFPSPRRRV